MEETLSLFVTTERRKKLMVRRNNPAVNGGGGGRSGDGDHPFFVEGSQVEVSSDDEGFLDAWYVATIIGIDKNAPPPSSPSSKRKRGTKKYLVEYETLLADDEDDEMSKKPLREYVDVSFMRPLPPPPSSSSGGDGGQETYELNDVVDAFHRDGWWTGVVRRVIDDGSKFVVFFQNPPEEFEFGRSELRVHHDWVDCKWVRAEKKTECIVEKASMSIKGPRKKLKGSGTEKSRWSPGESPVKYMRSKKKHLNDPESPNDKEIIEPKGKGGVSYENRTRGRSRKVLVESPIGFVKGEEKNGPEDASHEIGLKDSEEIEDVQWTVASEEKSGAEAASYAMAVNDCAANVVAQSTVAEVYLRGIVGINQGYPSQLPQGNSNIMSNIMDLHLAKIDNQLSEAIAEKSGRRRKSCASKIRKPRSITSNKSPTQDACREKKSEESEARPQLTWREGIDSPSTVDESRMSFDLNVIQSAEDGDRQDESAMQSSGIASANNDVSPKKKKSPFEKHSPIWGTLERMEIFQKMPQQPHFSPLVKSKEESREGLAIGNMVIFASVVEKTSKLQLSDPRCIIDSSLETLADLENHGFDVEPIRGRLNELLSMKERQGHLLEESKGVERKIAEQSRERGKIAEEIGLIKKKMKELQEKLALATSMVEMKDHEIAALKSERDVMDQEIQNTQHDFRRIAAAPW